MSFRDYSLTPASNVTLADGTYIGPNMLRNKVRPALQQIAADGKALSDDFDERVALAKGDPGGNIMATGLFIGASGLTIPTGTDVVRTAGYSVNGVGVADYFEDAAVDAAYVTANPRVSFISANGRGFRLDPNQRLTIEMFGGMADDNGVTATDNLPALNVAATYAQAFNRNPTGPFAEYEPNGRRIHYGKGRYYHGGTFEPRLFFDVQGESTGSYVSGGRGGTVWSYPADTLAVRSHTAITVGDGTVGVHSGSSAGSLIDGFDFECRGGTDKAKHCVYMRAGIYVRNCAFYNIPGNGIHISANAGYGGALEGDANDWVVQNCRVYSCGGYGLRVTGLDSNAGLCTDFKVFGAGYGGIYDDSALGSTVYSGIQISGYDESHTGRVSHGGNLYALRDAAPGIGASTTPGTNNLIWHYIGAGAPSVVFPAWSGSNTYVMGLPVYGAGASTRNVFIGVYVEGTSPCCLEPPNGSIYIGGQSGWTPDSAGLAARLSSTSAALASGTGVGGVRTFSPPHPQLGNYVEATVGAYPGSEHSILHHGNGAEGQHWIWKFDLAGNTRYSYFNSPAIWSITGPLTTKQFGTGVAQPHKIELTALVLGDPDSADNSRVHRMGSAAPTTGAHAQGEIVFNVAPVAGGKIGWVCVTAGTPGTWKPFGAIDA